MLKDPQPEPSLRHFADFGSPVAQRFQQLSQHELFVVDVDDLFASYLASFPEGTNPIFRERTEHDCSCCKQFVRTLGKLVAIIDGKVETVWDVPNLPYPYDIVAERLDHIVRQAPIISVFRTKERQYGTSHNYDTQTNQRWDHFHGKVADAHYHRDPATVRGRLNENADMLKRACTELQPHAVATVLDLIESNALYRGQEHRPAILNFRDLQNNFIAAPDKNLFAWANLQSPGVRFRNTVIGTLVTDISNGVDLEAAVRMFESKVAPHNYKRPTALITPKMIDTALAKIEELGLSDALERRFAKLSDVSVNDVLFVDRSVAPKMRDGIRDQLMAAAKQPSVDIKNPTKISGQAFLDMLPTVRSMQILLQNRHLGNFVSLTTGDSASRLFKWDNPFAWSYDGDVADSVKERVKKAGGNISAPMRFSLSWFNYDDLDLHVIEPGGTEIYYASKRGRYGVLDVDMNAGSGRTREAVENIVFQSPPDGIYQVIVNNFSKRETIDVGFELQFEFKGAINNYSFTQAVPNHGNVAALDVTVRHGQVEKIELGKGLTGGSAPVDKWGLRTEQLVPVNIFMLSPNHWGGQNVGNKHFMFFMDKCINPNPARGIYNEFLRPDLEEHRKVFEVLGAKTKCPPSDEQLSGLGFSSTRGDNVVLVVNNQAYEVEF